MQPPTLLAISSPCPQHDHLYTLLDTERLFPLHPPPLGLLPRLLGSSLALGITPGQRTLRALIKVCQDLDSRACLGPFAYAASPSARIGPIILEEALCQARLALTGMNALLGLRPCKCVTDHVFVH